MKNKLSFELNNLEIKSADLKIESLKITVDVDMEPEVALKNLAALAKLGDAVNQIVNAIKEAQ